MIKGIFIWLPKLSYPLSCDLEYKGKLIPIDNQPVELSTLQAEDVPVFGQGNLLTLTPQRQAVSSILPSLVSRVILQKGIINILLIVATVEGKSDNSAGGVDGSFNCSTTYGPLGPPCDTDRITWGRFVYDRFKIILV
jgi:hypothetical protein